MSCDLFVLLKIDPLDLLAALLLKGEESPDLLSLEFCACNRPCCEGVFDSSDGLLRPKRGLAAPIGAVPKRFIGVEFDA